MEFIITDDNSLTFRNLKIDELYHTKAGAIVEALEKHARALAVWEKENPVIFDVCSGLSYNAACAVEEIRARGNDSFITVYLFENDADALQANLQIEDTIEYTQDGAVHVIKNYIHFKNAVANFLKDKSVVYENDNLKIIIVFGDFMNTMDSVEDKADFIFYAPFSPVFTPDMWTQDVFTKLYAHMNSGGKLSTYSYARKVRDGLSNAGFVVQNGPTLGRRSPSIIAIKE